MILVIIVFLSINYMGSSVEFAPGNALYVSLSGNDTTGVGSFDSPWRTINYGVSQMSSEGGDVLYIRGGVYYELVEDFVSGTEGNPNVVIEYPDETVVISAGGELSGWEEFSLNENIVYRKYTTWSSKHTRPKKLFANDETMTWAQYPNEGFLYPNEERDGPITFISSDGFRNEDPDDHWINSTIVFYGTDVAGWGFAVNRVITDYDQDTKTIFFDEIDKDLSTNIPFIIRGNVQELDSSDEWAVDLKDTEGYVYFYPDGPINDQYVVVARKGMAVNISQKSNIEVRDISVYHSNHVGYSSRASLLAGSSSNILLDNLDVSLATLTGIRINDSSNIIINDLTSQHVGGSAVLFYSSEDVVLSNSHISNGGEDYQVNSAVGYRYECDGVNITNNYIGDNYYNYQTGLGIFLGTKNVYIANNEFRNNHGNNVLLEDSSDDFPDSAVKNIIFENNILANARASYTGSLWLDNAHNVIVRNNLIYGTYGSTANGIKISSSNLKPGPKPGYSKNITVVNNVIYDNTYGMYVYANESINISHNTFVGSRLNGFATIYAAGDITFKDNLIQSDYSNLRIATDTIQNHNRSDDFDNNYYAPSSNVTYRYDDSMTVDRFIIGENYYLDNYFNFTEYQNAFPGQELNSVNRDRIAFVDESNLDFRPVSGSVVCGAASDGSDIGALPCYSPSDETPLGDTPGGGDPAGISSNYDGSDSSSQDVEGTLETPGNVFHSAWYFIESNTPGVIIILTIVAMIIGTADYVYLRRKKSNNFLK
jgi:parallel beta-helix repeat protein